jgi:hypothetical protein
MVGAEGQQQDDGQRHAQEDQKDRTHKEVPSRLTMIDRRRAWGSRMALS